MGSHLAKPGLIIGSEKSPVCRRAHTISEFSRNSKPACLRSHAVVVLQQTTPTNSVVNCNGSRSNAWSSKRVRPRDGSKISARYWGLPAMWPTPMAWPGSGRTSNAKPTATMRSS